MMHISPPRHCKTEQICTIAYLTDPLLCYDVLSTVLLEIMTCTYSLFVLPIIVSLMNIKEQR